MTKLIEIIDRDKSNSTKLTITPTRVTLKISHKHADKFTQDGWITIADKLSDIEVSASHRGWLQFLPYGFYTSVKTENDKHIIEISYYEQLDKLIVEQK